MGTIVNVLVLPAGRSKNAALASRDFVAPALLFFFGSEIAFSVDERGSSEKDLFTARGLAISSAQDSERESIYGRDFIVSAM
jgi:hypothetical protein